MNSPIQEDGNSGQPAADPSEENQEPKATVHDDRNALIEAATVRNHEERTAENAAAGFDVNSNVHQPNTAPEPDEDPLDGFRPAADAPAQQAAPANVSEGLVDREVLHVEGEQPAAQVPEEFADDPLFEFLAMDENDQVVFRAKVNGEEQLIPLDKARATIQKHEAADARLQNANKQQAALDAREATVALREQDLQTRLQTMHTAPNQSEQSSADAVQDDESLEKEAREMVSGIFTGTEDEAAAKLVSLMKKNRGAQATPVDPKVIAAEAVTAARQQLTTEARNKDIDDGYASFSNDYPEILADDNLYRYADGLTDTIRTEHPDWAPSKVMLEAGKRTREWVQSMKTPTQPNQPNDREERKQRLRPIPRLRRGTPEGEAPERVDTPSSVLDEIRASRGQVA